MATHTNNRYPNTNITDSDITITELNINKTSTQEEILANLPRYFTVDVSLLDLSDNSIPITPAVKVAYINYFQLFINGELITQQQNNDNTLTGYYLYPSGTKISILDAQTLALVQTPGVIVYALYTEN